MSFKSLQFLIFFPIVTIAYFCTPNRWRWLLLLLASCYFYMAFIPAYLLILFFTILVDYSAGRLIERAQGQRRKMFLLMSIVANLGVLAVFKYFNFFSDNVSQLAHALNMDYVIPHLALILPIGLSFHTFQALSYTIEVYRGNQPAERHLGILALYVLFYPQLAAGPIERPQHLLHQFREPHKFEYERVTSGLKLMAWGFFKKVVIADRLGTVVDGIYNHPHDCSGALLSIATICFAVQIYCDFCGYTDIAIGSARVMGIDLIQNFRRPYFANSIADFWHRWNISLSTWFRDYLYIPLGGNRVGPWRRQLNVLATFAVSGLWHGADWTFMVWGFLHGMFCVISSLVENFYKGIRQVAEPSRSFGLQRALQMIVTFLLVSFAWIFFRANNLTDSLYIATHLLDGLNVSIDRLGQSNVLSGIARTGLSVSQWLVVLSAIGVVVAVESIQESQGSFAALFARQPALLRWSGYYALLFSILALGNLGKSPFIYFQF